MRRDHLRAASLIAASATVGWIGWSGNVLSLPTAALFPAVWSLSRTRGHAVVVSAAYFLAASRGLPQGVANFYSSDIWPGLLLWLMASAGFVIVHSVLWTARAKWRKPLRYLVACVVIALPPFGITGWAHPVTAAGVLFPAWGWWGLLAMTTGLVLMTTRHSPLVAIVMTGFWLWSAAEWAEPILPASWQGVDLDMGSSLGRDASLERQEALIQLVARQAPGAIVVLPESALGFWTPTLARLWQARLAGTRTTVIAGAAIIEKGGYDNVLVSISPDGSDIVYRERMPVPGSMWQPWSSRMSDGGSARAHVFANPVVRIADTSIAPLICYEQLIVWPILQSMLHDPDVVIAVGNGWWTAGTSIVDIQRASTLAWARLFDKPLVTSFNS
ncbi:conjugal transfer protein TraB [Rhizobium sp. AC44/96]|uniref:conjugal transfer protein TraB n=1 Tax=unclassified Rhizobium TaxID=2613769 RepID=UPI00080FEECA|nr:MULTISPECIES: conjugal transfer protein TraB [unclassified Rhizobium]MDM9621924.1 conjugal transfer protein TraB [Rhizobium sp. S96]OCJ17200.1 conjugal transfer protein TraB [Rhizobium sp. AC44/96]